MVEHADYVGDLEAALVTEAEVPEGLPVALDDARGRRTQLVRHLAQCPLPIRERGRIAPPSLLDRSRQLIVTVLRTEELCVGLRSVDAVLRRRRDGGDELAFFIGEDTFAEHRLEEQRSEAGTDARVGSYQSGHVRDHAVVSESAFVRWR